MAHTLGMRGQTRLGSSRDHRTHIGGQLRGIPDDHAAHGAGKHRDDAVGDLLLQVQHAQRRAALAGTGEGRGDGIIDHLFRQRGGIHHHGIHPARLGDQRQDRPIALCERAVDGGGRGRGTGEGDTGKRRVGEGHRPEGRPVGGGELQHRGRHAGLVQQPGHRVRHQGCCGGRLCHHAVAGCQGCGDLAGEYRQREVPRADAHERTPAVQRERVALTRRATQFLRGTEQLTRAGRVVATEVHRFAQFRHCIRQRLARFPHQQAQKLPATRLQRIRRALKAGGALSSRQRIPGRLGGAGASSAPGRSPRPWHRG